MKIKNIYKKSKKNNIFLFYKIYFFISIFVISSVSLLFFNTGYWKNYKNEFFNRLHISSVYNYIYLPQILLLSLKSNFYDIEKLNLNISFENIINLENQRDKALKNRGWSINFSEVSSKIDYLGVKYDSDVRLKGARKIHYNEKKNLSYKIKINGEKKIFGLRKFSLQKPRVRNYAHEWLFHELIGQTDLIKIKYKFIELSINGSKPSLYAVEEGFDKILLERNNRRNGPIFSLHEEYSVLFHQAKFEVYNKGFWLNDENINFTINARKKLEEFRDGKIKLDEVFDIERWSEFLALTDLNYYNHATAPKSVKFFYNPVSALFEPIGYDAHRAVPNFNNAIKDWLNLPILTAFDSANKCSKDLLKCKEMSNSLTGDFFLYKIFFNYDGSINSKFFKSYQTNVLKFSSKEYLDEFFKIKQEEIKKINSLIYGDFFFVDHNYFYGPGIYYFSKEDIYKRANDLQNKYKIDLSKITIEQNKDKLKISNLSINNNLLKISAINCKNNKKESYEIFSFNEKYIESKKFINIKNFKKNDLLVCKEVIFRDQYGKILTKKINLGTSIKNLTKLDPNEYKKKFFIEGKKLKLKNRVTLIDKNIVIPAGYVVNILPGYKINLINNAIIFSNSPWIANGSENIIQISGLRENFGGGIYFNNVKKKSFFKNVKFEYLSGLKKPFFYENSENYLTTISTYKNNNTYFEKIYLNPGKEILHNLNYSLMGSINFFKSDVELNKVYFNKICSEDALNVVSSNFKVINSKFKENCSDSIDIDFGIGEISNTSFDNIGNDAIDFSGSVATVKNINLDNVGDKLISIGERSTVNIENISASDAFVGIVSKDESVTKINNLNFKNIKLALAAYIKKNEYNKSKIVGNNIKVDNSKIFAITDFESEIIINNQKISNKKEDLLKIIYKKNLALLN